MGQIQTLKGFRDYLPSKMRLRKKVISTLEQVFERYGFEPLQTPTLEYAEVLTGKYGEEADKLMYLFTDHGGRQVGLNYDLTVPTARILAQYANSQINLPFKRYQIQPSYRAENTQKGRYRQFTQCDIDSFGTKSPLADAEILAVIHTSLTALGFSDFTIRINSRQILKSLNLTPEILQSIDKLDKKSKEEVEQELADKGLKPEQIKTIFTNLDTASPDSNLTQVLKLAETLGVSNYRFDPFLVRGLDYYTGPIFETVVKEPKIGSVTGGGRYDNLIQQLGGPDIPATGTTIGLDRICDCLEELRLFTDSVTSTKILITVFSPDTLPATTKIYQQVLATGINTEIYLGDNLRMDKQLKYASNRKIPFAIILGPEELQKNILILKNLQTGNQTQIDHKNINQITAHVLAPLSQS